MNPQRLDELLQDVSTGKMTPAAARERLKTLPFESLGFACLDHHRPLRRGFPEVIFGAGKTPEQLATIFDRLAASGANVLATRVHPDAAALVRARHAAAEYAEAPRVLHLRQQPAAVSQGVIAVVCAGTSDLPVAEEARLTLELMDQQVQTYYDVGVAGLHRLLAHAEALQQARVLIVVAGMEGALPSVVGGLVAAPVIAVPTSIGYGASFGGLAALLAMLNTCSPGISVVNIDNGFGAAYQAAMINRAAERGASGGI